VVLVVTAKVVEATNVTAQSDRVLAVNPVRVQVRQVVDHLAAQAAIDHLAVHAPKVLRTLLVAIAHLAAHVGKAPKALHAPMVHRAVPAVIVPVVRVVPSAPLVLRLHR
jgi:hypothetical protein